MRSLLAVADRLDRLVTRIGRIGAWAVVLLVLVTVFDIATRNASQSDWPWLRDLIARQQAWFGSTMLQELEWHLHTVLFMLCLGMVYLRDGHVRIDIVRERLGARTKAAIEVAGTLLFLLPFAGLVLWFGWDFLARSFEQNEASASATGLPYRWIIKAFLPAGFALLALAGIAVLFRALAALCGRR